MGKKRILRRLAPLCLLAALLVMTTATLAWMKTNETNNSLYVALSDFEVEGKLLFGDQVYDQGSSILVDVNLTDPSHDQYIGKLKFQVAYTGVSPAYVRVRVLEQWLDITNQEILSSNYLPYHVTGAAFNVLADGGQTVLAGGSGQGAVSPLADPGEWIDERAQDFCYYYSVPVRPRKLAAGLDENNPQEPILQEIKDGAILLTLMDQTAGDADNAKLLQSVDTDHTQLSLRFEVEAVQPNRFREFFGREIYPEVPTGEKG